MCLVTQACLTLWDPMDCSPPGSAVHGDSPGKNTGVGCHALLQGIFPTQGLKPRAPALQAESLPSEPPGKSMNTGVGSLSLLQGIFLTKKLNWGLLHCRWILYQLSHLGSPILSLCECLYAFPLECKLYESRNNFIYNYMIYHIYLTLQYTQHNTFHMVNIQKIFDQ